MIDKNLFLETLHEVAEIAATSSEKIKPEEVHRYFEGMELSEERKNGLRVPESAPEAMAARQPGVQVKARQKRGLR